MTKAISIAMYVAISSVAFLYANDRHIAHGRLSLIGPPLTIFDSSVEACDQQDIPDAPARAFRNQNSEIVLFASHYINRSFVGTNLKNLTHSCQIAFKGKNSSNPLDFDDYGWLTGFQTTDGTKINALVHNEFHGNERKDLCPSGSYQRCWENAITSAISIDGGQTFTRVPGKHGNIAFLPYPYEGDRSGPSGYFNPTNIIKFEDFYYYFMSFIDPKRDKSGVCLMRTKSPNDPSSWRAWDGVYFTAMLNQSADSNHTGDMSGCEPIKNLMFAMGSVSYHKKDRRFVAIMRRQAWEKSVVNPEIGAYFSYSTDLIHWDVPELLLSDKSALQYRGEADLVQYYPSMIDFDDRNFDMSNIRGTPYLITTEFRWDEVNKKRKLLAWPLRFGP